MNADVQINDFEKDMDEWVRAALVRGVRTFPELVRSLPGVYPADALRVLRRLRQELPVDWQFSGTFSASQPLDGWPVEHPLDFDWRFTPEAIRLLLEACRSRDPDSVAFLGTPSLAREAATHNWQASLSLFERNPAIVEALCTSLPHVAATCIDLVQGDPVGFGDAAVAVADPPWYPEETVAFLWAAARLTRIGGTVLFSLPPVGTRPGIRAERDSVLEWASDLGLRLESVQPGILAYQTPPFERNALAAAGVPEVPWDWRRGDLATFSAVRKTSHPRPQPPALSDTWDEVSSGSVRIKFKRNSDFSFRDPTLSSLVPGDMLSTVSRRECARGDVDVWTCGNRVFRCSGSSLFGVILSALGRSGSVEDAVAASVGRGLLLDESVKVRKAAAQAKELLQMEDRESLHHERRHHESDLAEVT